MAFPYVDHTWAVGNVLTIARMNNLESQFQSILDLLTTRGDISYRGAATWERLAKGTEGQYLRQGANDPAWASVDEITIVRKAADQTVNNSIALVNDTHLLFAVGTNETWEFTLVLRYNSNAAADIDFAITVPAASTLNWAIMGISPAQAPQFGVVIVSADRYSAFGKTADYLAIIKGVAITAGTAGNVQLQWCQDTQDVSDTKVLEDSVLTAWQIA